MSIDEVMAIAAEYSRAWLPATIRDRLRAAIKQHVAEEVVRETERLRGVLLTLANAADDVGVQFFDMEDPPISVAQMRSATLAARAALQEAKP